MFSESVGDRGGVNFILLSTCKRSPSLVLITMQQHSKRTVSRKLKNGLATKDFQRSGVGSCVIHLLCRLAMAKLGFSYAHDFHLIDADLDVKFPQLRELHKVS